MRHIDINHPLPPPRTLPEIRGVLVWMETNAIKSPLRFLRWAEEMVAGGKRFVLIGDWPFSYDLQGRETDSQSTGRFLAQLGLQSVSGRTLTHYRIEILHQDPAVVGFERSIPRPLPPFEGVRSVQEKARAHLIVRRAGDPSTDSHLVVTGPKGGYVAYGFSHFQDEEGVKHQWILNPFEFFRLAFATDKIPKPDTTTHSGRRIFYSHVDGDGWRNMTEVPHNRPGTLSAEVILKQVLRAFPDLPGTVAPIAADLDPEWFGSEQTQELARRMFSLRHVEAGTHTYSHPFEWGFFADGKPEKERPFLHLYPKHWGEAAGSILGWWSRFWEDPWSFFQVSADLTPEPGRDGTEKDALKNAYEVPRAYAVKPFDLDLEIQGSTDYIQQFLPAGKKVEVAQWSGNTHPFEQALEKTRESGLWNINGGDTRFDREFPSYAWVSPNGCLIGEGRQIYASNSNENTYTDLWSDRYFGFLHLVRTLRNTDRPWRLKPLNIYYHMYSGEKLSSLNALLANFRYARSQEIVALTTSDFAAMVDGFYTTSIFPLAERVWRIQNRGALQTFRFDQATLLAVDSALSVGVIGQRHYQGSLYVALDATESDPIIALKDHLTSDQHPEAPLPYLVQARWKIEQLRVGDEDFRFQAEGFGRGEMVWRVPRPGRFRVQVRNEGSMPLSVQTIVSQKHLLRLDLSPLERSPVQINVRRLPSGGFDEA